MSIWSGDIVHLGEGDIDDIHLSSYEDASYIVPRNATLRFLSLVDTTQIPLHMRIGPIIDVDTKNGATKSWLSKILCEPSISQQDGVQQREWWQHTRQSPLGVLVAIDRADDCGSIWPKATEILFLALTKTRTGAYPPTPPRSSSDRQAEVQRHTVFGEDDIALDIKAFALSSDLLHAADSVSVTPPQSPRAGQSRENDSHFLSTTSTIDAADLAGRVTAAKRKSVAEAFDNAGQQRKQTKHNIGDSIAAVASNHRPSSRPEQAAKPTTSTSEARKSRQPSTIPIQNRPLSRSPSLSNSLADSRRGSVSEAPRKRSTLSRVQSAADGPNHDEALETRNKETLSRLIMAGMRLHGLSQSKNRMSDSRRGSVAPSKLDPGTQTADIARVGDEANSETYKLVYHQTMKAATFAFRNSMCSVDLKLHMDVLHETVEKLLVLFCSDPLASGAEQASGADDGLTPSGKEVFGSAQAERVMDAGFDRPTLGTKDGVSTRGYAEEG